MPAKKSARQSLKRYYRNRGVRRATRTAINEAMRAVESGDAAAAESPVDQAIRALDVAVKKGILHRNNASRGKSRLAIKLNRLRGDGSS